MKIFLYLSSNLKNKNRSFANDRSSSLKKERNKYHNHDKETKRNSSFTRQSFLKFIMKTETEKKEKKIEKSKRKSIPRPHNFSVSNLKRIEMVLDSSFNDRSFQIHPTIFGIRSDENRKEKENKKRKADERKGSYLPLDRGSICRSDSTFPIPWNPSFRS